MSEPDLSPKPIPTVQTALFVGSWLTSWWALLKNSILMLGAPQDVVIVAPAVILLLGLILTNVQGYFEEKAREEYILAKAAVVDGDLLLLLHRDGRRICAGKPTKAWKRLQVRQALGRGIPLSMVSFYLASRSVIEDPVCQLSSLLSRSILSGNEKGTCQLTEALEDQKQICNFDLPFGFGLGCQSSEELNHTTLLKQINDQSPIPWGTELPVAEEAVWKSGHCRASTWRLQPAIVPNEECAYQPCLMADPPHGPSTMFNKLLYGLFVKSTEDNKEVKRSVQRLVRKWNKLAAFGLNFLWKRVLKEIFPRDIFLGTGGAVVIASRRNWLMDFLLGFIFLLASMLPLAKSVQERRRLKFLIHKVPIWIHFGLDILLVECAAVGILASLFIRESGAKITEFADLVLRNVGHMIDSAAASNQISTLNDLVGTIKGSSNPSDWKEVIEGLISMVKGLADPLMVTPEFFLLFGIAVVFFCSLSTVFVRKTSVAQEMPWLTQWNAAVGGPLLLLGSVRDDEVRALSPRAQGQIVLRGLLLTLLLGIFMFPVRPIDTAFATAFILYKPTSRTPWTLAWFCLWGVHMVTGLLAVNTISENQALRDEDRWLRDMETYGACGVPSQGLVMGMKPKGLPNTPAIPQAQPPGLQVPQAQPPGLQVPQVQPPGLQVPQVQPPGLQVPQAQPPGLQVAQSAGGALIPAGHPSMQAQQPSEVLAVFCWHLRWTSAGESRIEQARQSHGSPNNENGQV
eukprot:symbB.v1.2.033281.t1/scaffold4110.1/size46135/6